MSRPPLPLTYCPAFWVPRNGIKSWPQLSDPFPYWQQTSAAVAA